jgi:cyclohexa-1,5-dienecarbonyl-CoA hydratase
MRDGPRRALVTGGSSGIGRCVAETLARDGCDVGIFYLGDAEEGRPVTQAIEAQGRRAWQREGDVSDAAQARDAVNAFADELGGLEILVNSAGIIRDRVIWKMSDEEWQQVIDVDLTGVFNCARAAAAIMRSNGGGSIVSISSVIGLRGRFGQTNYAAAKAGVIGLTKSLAHELARARVTASGIDAGRGPRAAHRRDPAGSCRPRRGRCRARRVPVQRPGAVHHRRGHPRGRRPPHLRGSTAMGDYEFCEVSVGEGIAEITLNHPPLNVLNNPMMAELNAILDAVLPGEDLAAVVFRASGKAFCAGVDVGDHTADKVAPMIELFHGIFRKLASTDALTIAALNGAALGGGCELACFCDIVLASERAKLGQPEVQVGVFPPVAACILPLQIGVRKAVELNAVGATVKADEALRIGLVSHVYAAAEFDDRVEAYLNDIRKLSRPVVRMAKKATVLVARRAILAHLEQAEHLYLEELMKLSDAHEGIAAFIEKRAPAWSHA